MTIADVDGVTIEGLLFDAAETESPVLLEVGPERSKARHSNNPDHRSHDVFFRVGGAGIGSAKVNLAINSNDDHRRSHLDLARRSRRRRRLEQQHQRPTASSSTGDNVTAYGLFVEHHQEFQVLWNGNDGRTYFYQSEIPYDPPDQAQFHQRARHANGWASYKVADNVTSHEAWGSASTASFAIRTSGSPAPSKFPALPTSASTT